jgi:hypothetical protein
VRLTFLATFVDTSDAVAVDDVVIFVALAILVNVEVATPKTCSPPLVREVVVSDEVAVCVNREPIEFEFATTELRFADLDAGSIAIVPSLKYTGLSINIPPSRYVTPLSVVVPLTVSDEKLPTFESAPLAPLAPLAPGSVGPEGEDMP